MMLPAASRTWPVSGSSAPITLPAESTTLPVAPSRTPTTLPAESSTVVPSTRSVTVPSTSPTVLSTWPVSGSSTPTTLPEASTTLPVAPSRTPMTLPAASTTEAPSTRLVTEPTMAPAESTTSPVVSLSVPTMAPVGVDHVAGALVERADDVRRWSRPPRCRRRARRQRAAASAAAASRVGGVRLSSAMPVAAIRPGWSAAAVSVPVGAVPSVTVSDWSIVLSWMPVAIASASTVWVTHDALVGQRLRVGAVGEQVGADRGVDRRHDVGVQRDGEVDRCGAVDGQVDVGGEVEDRDDLLVRAGRSPPRPPGPRS